MLRSVPRNTCIVKRRGGKFKCSRQRQAVSDALLFFLQYIDSYLPFIVRTLAGICVEHKMSYASCCVARV